MKCFTDSKVGCVIAMVAVSILPHAKIERNDHREDAPHFIPELVTKATGKGFTVKLLLTPTDKP